MIRLTLKTPFKKDLMFTWKDRKIEASGDKEVLQYWDILKSNGMYGKYGHILDPEDCYLIDFISALVNKIGWEKIKMNPDAKLQLSKEEGMEEASPIPEGAMT